MSIQHPVHVQVADLAQHVGATVVVRGFVETLRLQKAVQFVVLRDRTGLVQLVHRREVDAGLAEQIDELTPESTVAVTGEVVADDRVKLGGLELRLSEVDVAARAQSPLPIDERSGPELRLDHPWLALRDPRRRLVFETQTALLAAMREYWTARDMIELHTPKLMGAPSESGAEVFAIEYFGGQAYLAQSPQFYKQLAIAAGFDGVFEVGPVFRAEPSHTSRHVTEYTSVDVELAWVDSHEDVMRHEEQLLVHALEAAEQHLGEQLTATFGTQLEAPPIPFPRVPIAEARELLVSETAWRPSASDDGTLDPAGERALSAYIEEHEGHPFVFVTDYPVDARPFYHRRHDGRPDLTMSFDLLYRGIEITTGAQREHRYETLVSQAQQAGMSTELLASYLDSFRYGCPPHGGFGLGLERLIMSLLGLDSIRDACFLPRTPTRLTP